MGYDRRMETAMLSRVRYINEKEFLKLLAVTRRNRRAYLLFYLLGNTGLRLGEAHALRACDIAPRAPVIQVHTARHKEAILHDLHIPRVAARKIRRWIKALRIGRQALLFPWTIRNSQKMWYKYSTKAGLRIRAGEHNKGRGIYALHNFWALRMIEKKAPPVFVLKQLRHNSLSTFDRYYETIRAVRLAQQLG